MIEILGVKEQSRELNRDTIVFLADLCEQARQADKELAITLEESNYSVRIWIHRVTVDKNKDVFDEDRISITNPRSYCIEKFELDELDNCISELLTIIKNEPCKAATEQSSGTK